MCEVMEAAVAFYLSEDLLMEIIKRLPVKKILGDVFENHGIIFQALRTS